MKVVEILGKRVSPEKRVQVKQLLEQYYTIFDIDNDVVLKYCELYTSLKKKGLLLSDADLLIAAIAIFT